jgi:hypothetical protein
MKQLNSQVKKFQKTMFLHVWNTIRFLNEKDAQCILYRINYSRLIDIKYRFAQFYCAAKLNY